MVGMLHKMQSTPEGRLAASRMLAGYKYAQNNHLFDDLPPIGGPPAPPPGVAP